LENHFDIFNGKVWLSDDLLKSEMDLFEAHERKGTIDLTEILQPKKRQIA
jgi:hypothetical protein